MMTTRSEAVLEFFLAVLSYTATSAKTHDCGRRTPEQHNQP